MISKKTLADAPVKKCEGIHDADVWEHVEVDLAHHTGRVERRDGRGVDAGVFPVDGRQRGHGGRGRKRTERP